MNDGGRTHRGSFHPVRSHPELVVRAPNHLGDLCLALPALHRAAAGAVVVRRHLVPLLELARLPSRIVPLDPGPGGMFRCAAELRHAGFRRGVLLTPSLSAALIFRLAALPERRGTRTDHRGPLLTEAVSPEALAGLHRATAYVVLVCQTAPPELPRPKLELSDARRGAWRALVGEETRDAIGVFPGGNASSRRWDPDRFRELVQRLADDGHRVIVFGGPAERDLTREVAGDRGLDMGGLTDLPLLAAGLADCRVLVTNDSGPMHLAAAVGTPTVSLWGAGNPRETCPLGPGHRMVRHAELPCVPCVKNRCPRSGRGTFLDEADRECLALVTVDEVHHAVERVLEETGR